MKIRMNVMLLLLGFSLLIAGCNNSPQGQSAATPGGAGGQGGRGPGGPGGGGGPSGPGGGRGGPGGGGAMGILMIEEARTAMGVTEEQNQKLREAGQALSALMPRPQQGQMPDPDQMREQMQKFQAESRKNIEAILSADQVAQLDVMVFQRSGGLNPPAPTEGSGGPGGGRGPGGPSGGPAGGINVDSLRALNLSDDQVQKVQEAVDQRIEATLALGPGGGGPGAPQPSDDERAARREAIQKINDVFYAAVNDILTDDQKAKAEELMKDVPEFLQRPPARGPGGPGGGR